MSPTKNTEASPNKTAPTAAGTLPQLNEGETRLIIGIFLNMARPSPDWQAVADAIGSASAEAARVRFGRLWKKIELYQGNNGGLDLKSPKSVNSTPGKKRKRAVIAEDENDGEGSGKEGDTTLVKKCKLE